MKIFISLFLTVLVSGCSLILPYEDEFQCTLEANTGKCVDVDGAYQESIGTKKPAPYAGKEEEENTEEKEKGSAVTEPAPSNISDYENEQYKVLTGLLREPETPIVRNPKVVRTLILSYPAEGREDRLYMPRYVYSIEKNPQFVFGQYQLQKDVGIDFFKAIQAQSNQSKSKAQQ